MTYMEKNLKKIQAIIKNKNNKNHQTTSFKLEILQIHNNYCIKIHMYIEEYKYSV